MKPHAQFQRDGDNIHLTVTLTFPQAALGDEIEVPTVDGKVKLKIPAGTQSGEKFRLRGKGVQNVRGYGKGDQYVTVQVKTPTKMNERQKELLREFASIDDEKPTEYSTSFFDKMRRAFKGE